MADGAVFLDTVALLALVNRDDALHGACRHKYQELASARCPLATSDWVLAELLGAAARLPLRAAACRIIERLRGSPRVAIVPATREHWIRAFDLFAARRDKEWSFVDCSSMLICQDAGIRQVLTRDRHFVQAGLTILLP